MSRWARLCGALIFSMFFACDGEPPPSKTVDLVQDVATMATGAPLEAHQASDQAAALMDGRLALDAWLDGLLQSPSLGEVVAKGVILGPVGPKGLHPVTMHSVLKRTDDARPVYYLGERCSAASAVEVSPWWAPNTTVLVCPSAYRPEVREDSEGRACGASTVNPLQGAPCGCGPRLVYCTKDSDQYESLRESVTAELEDTLALVINEDLPIEQLFLMNESVRDRDAELVYLRARILAGEDDDLVEQITLDARPRLAPRHEQVEGQHAGILTMPVMVYGSDALRGTMRNFYEDLWCSGASNSRVTTSAVLGLSVVDLREGDGWKDLAAMDICTDCHARLDYGMQFFSGFPSSTRGIDFRPELAQRGLGPLYGEDIGDPRGEAPLNPLGFARLALAQPEFGDCLTRKVSDYVFSGEATPEDVDAVRSAFDEEHSFRAMMRVALRRFVIDAMAEDADAVAAPARLPTSTPGKLSDETYDRVQNSCTYCHDGGDARDLLGPDYDRETLVAMLQQVSFGLMPPDDADLYPEDRAALVEGLLDALWEDEAERAAAARFYQGGLRALPVHGYRASLKTAATRAGGSEALSLRSVETAVPKALQRYSPNLAVSTGLAALDACKDEGHTGAALDACVREASDPAAFVVGDPTAP